MVVVLVVVLIAVLAVIFTVGYLSSLYITLTPAPKNRNNAPVVKSDTAPPLTAVARYALTGL